MKDTIEELKEKIREISKTWYTHDPIEDWATDSELAGYLDGWKLATEKHLDDLKKIIED